LALLLLTVSPGSHAQVRIIFDTDIGGDADDLGALAMLHHFMDQGECDLLAIMCWSTEEFAVPAIDAVNRFYGHPDIPVGVRKDGIHHQAWNYNKPIADALPHRMTYEDVPGTTRLYRQILADSPDSDVVIVTVGPLKNIENLLRSGPDSTSPLSGKELIRKKVREFVIMGGQYPSGENEWNFNGDMQGVTSYVISNLPVPVTFSGYEVGLKIRTGEVFNDLPESHPLYVGFMHFSEHASWINKDFSGRILDNASYDQTAVLYAVRNGTGTWWEKVPGTCVPDDTGGNTWIPDGGSDHAYLLLKKDPEKMARIIESIMLGKR